MSDDGLIKAQSAFSVRETIDRFVAFVQSHGLMVFARIDHADGAAEAGLALRPTELLIFGHAKGGTPLMAERQTVGIDLPVKALAYEDAAGKVWLTCNDAAWIARRHGLGAASAEAVRAIAGGIAAAMKAATE
ncbi:MAG TPA: DUF302 domain-containing protein [Xanthobacteraceae bacterium]|jgi:uncharacterized protein (DUF302 family)|nr:DUF302 domain-containing protein [Xanthobacteraceae bacterium]